MMYRLYNRIKQQATSNINSITNHPHEKTALNPKYMNTVYIYYSIHLDAQQNVRPLQRIGNDGPGIGVLTIRKDTLRGLHVHVLQLMIGRSAEFGEELFHVGRRDGSFLKVNTYWI